MSTLLSFETICVVDIDTTLANNDHRAALLTRGPDGHITRESWNEFLRTELLSLDSPQKHARDVLDFMRSKNFGIVFLTGRSEIHREVTEAWLQAHMNRAERYEPLIMRQAKHAGMAASQYKELAFKEFLDGYEVWSSTFLFFEDDPHVLPMWQKYGLAFKCPEVWEFMNPERPQHKELAWSR